MKAGIVFGASGLLGPVWANALALKSDIVYCLGLGVEKDSELNELKKKYPKKIVAIEHDLTEPIKENFDVNFNFAVFSAANDSVPSTLKMNQNQIGMLSLSSWIPFLNNQVIFVNSLDFFCSNRSQLAFGVVIGSMYTTSLPREGNYLNEKNEIAFTKHPGYSSSKVAIKNIMQQYAVNFASDSLVLNMLSPGVVSNNHPDWFTKNMIQGIPNKKFINRIELIDSINFLTSNAAVHLVGQELLLDGGYSLW
jgi:NAD(P)-dependent dehydrogenase (short-subunit alcohol dehydrogenase family)